MENENDFFVDKYFVCKDCQEEFCWQAKDQRFITQCVENQTPHPVTGKIIEKVTAPVRCFECRNKRKEFFNKQNKK